MKFFYLRYFLICIFFFGSSQIISTFGSSETQIPAASLGTESKAMTMEIIMAIEKKFKEQTELLNQQFARHHKSIKNMVQDSSHTLKELHDLKRDLEADFRKNLDQAKAEFDLKEQKINEASQILLKGNIEKMIADIKTKIDEIKGTHGSHLHAKCENDKMLILNNAQRDINHNAQLLAHQYALQMRPILASQLEPEIRQKIEFELKAKADQEKENHHKELRVQMETEIRAKIAAETKEKEAQELAKKKAFDDAIQASQKQVLDAQRKNGKVSGGLFQGANSQNACTQVFHVNYWRCGSQKDKACWQQLLKEFQNCLYVNVQEGENKYTDETKRLLKLGEEKSK